MSLHTAETARPAALVERPDLAAEMRDHMRSQGVPDTEAVGLRCATLGKCQIIASQEGKELRWHLSISHPWRLPTWDEINAARDAMIPEDVWLCQPMPPKRYWINAHKHCLHLWQTTDRELIEQWAYDGCGDEEQAVRVARLASL